MTFQPTNISLECLEANNLFINFSTVFIGGKPKIKMRKNCGILFQKFEQKLELKIRTSTHGFAMNWSKRQISIYNFINDDLY